jgi:hypothetical protein
LFSWEEFKMKTYARLVIAAATSVLIVQSVKGQELDSCSPVLSDKLLSRRIQTNNVAYVAGEHHWACSASEAEIIQYITNADTRNFRHDGAVGYGQVLGIKGSWGNDATNESKSSSIQQWKSENCSESDRNLNYGAAGYFSSQFLAPEAIEAWRDCELHLTNKLASDVVIVYNWNSQDIELPEITAFYTMIADERHELPHTKELFIGPKETAIPRDASKAMRIVINAVHQRRYNKSCSVYLPAAPPVRAAQPSPPVVATQPRPTSNFIFGREGSPRPQTQNTVWDAYCPAGTTVIFGTCVSNAGAIPLQNFGPEPGGNRWACVWTEPMAAASVHAMCAK